jgi:quinol-cytochrome oxidoreductase complex cytochrome b subunit
VIVGVVVAHIWALHIHGSNNPLGIDTKGPQDKIPFHPYYTVKDLFGIGVFLIFYSVFVFFAPNFFGEPDNYIPANPLVTPPHIVPEWYFLPFYAILRAITFDIGIPFTSVKIIEAKLGGVIAMFGAIALLFLLPWLDTSRVRSARFRPAYKKVFWVFLIACFGLGYSGYHPPEGLPLYIGQASTFYYFAHFLVVLPLLGWFERPLPLPTSISEPVLGGGRAGAASPAKSMEKA